MWLWRQLICWVSFCVEVGSWWAACSSDPLDIPAPRGCKRVRRLNAQLVDAVGQSAGSASLGRSGACVVK
eukprot:11149179-Alexandrium_andersonii.AAC.1